MAVKISVAQVNMLRLRRQHLLDRAAKQDIARVVSDVCGIQAQVLSAAELALRARVEGIDQDDVRDALWKSRTILKTWCMRGTLHLIASSDLPLYVAALKSKLDEMEQWLRQNAQVSGAEVARVSAAVGAALSKRTLSREELSREVAKKTNLGPEARKALMSPWGVLLRPAAYQGHLAFGESVGNKVTFVNPALWVRPWDEPPASEAMLELFKRFLGAYGPAKIADFGHWWGDLSAEDRSVLDSIWGELVEVESGGLRGFMIRRDADEATGLEPSPGVHLLPSFDCYVMHYFPREIIVPAAFRHKIFSREAGWVFPPVVINGQAAGVWGIKKRKSQIEIGIEAFRVFSSKEKEGLETEAADVGRFLGSPVEVRYRPINRG
jgi:hypothetical protein